MSRGIVGFVVPAHIRHQYKQLSQGFERTRARKRPGFRQRGGTVASFFSPSPERGNQASLNSVSASARGRTPSASCGSEADDEFRCASQGCCVTRPARRAYFLAALPHRPSGSSGPSSLHLQGFSCRTPGLSCRLLSSCALVPGALVPDRLGPWRAAPPGTG